MSGPPRYPVPVSIRFRPSPCLVVPAVAAALLCLAGCVDRTVAIRSDPPGARVWLNDREVGRTPCEVGFTFYGRYDVRLEKEGCRPLWTSARTPMPWWEYPPFDLCPGRRHVRVGWDFDLEPAPAGPADDAALLRRAQDMQRAERDAAFEASGR